MHDPEELLHSTVELVKVALAAAQLSLSDVPGVIASTYAALERTGQPKQEPQLAVKREGAVSVRSSIKPDHIVSMIDGKPYKMLRRHISQHGFTPESYREAYGLPRDYPMVAASYAEQRRALAHKIGLGRKPGATRGAVQVA